MKTIRILGINFLIVLVFTAAAYAQSRFWAMDVGNYWTYSGTSDPYGGSWTWRNGVAARDTTTCPVTTYLWEGKENSGPVEEKTWFEVSDTYLKTWRLEIYDDEDLYWIKVIPNNGYTILKKPILVSDTWTENTNGTVIVGPTTYNNQALSANVTVQSYANLTVPLGTYKAYKVHIVLSVPDLSLTRTQDLWVVPYLGLIRIDTIDPGETEIETLTSMKIRKPIVDRDSDAKTDQAFYRPETGVWFVLPSGGGSYYGTYFGAAASDILVPGDYDGDGKTDLAFYRPSTGVWFIKPSGGSPSWYAVYFGGGASDIPLTYNY